MKKVLLLSFILLNSITLFASTNVNTNANTTNANKIVSDKLYGMWELQNIPQGKKKILLFTKSYDPDNTDKLILRTTNLDDSFPIDVKASFVLLNRGGDYYLAIHGRTMYAYYGFIKVIFTSKDSIKFIDFGSVDYSGSYNNYLFFDKETTAIFKHKINITTASNIQSKS